MELCLAFGLAMMLLGAVTLKVRVDDERIRNERLGEDQERDSTDRNGL